MEAQRPTAVVLATTAALYLAFALVPAGLAVAGAGGWLWQRASLPSNAHFTPLVDGLGVLALVGVALTALLSVVPAFVLGVRRLPRDLRLGVGVALLTLHVPVMMAMLGSVAGVGVLPLVLDGERLVGRAAETDGSRAALLYRDNDACTWAVYVSEPLDPIALEQSRVRCDCRAMREAHVVWRAADPELLDPTGSPFTCPPPPSTCASANGPLWLAMLVPLALVARRRRAVRAPCRAA
ncbi:MAG: hypothetical protein R3F61_10470 [Myxococcota bacterium]